MLKWILTAVVILVSGAAHSEVAITNFYDKQISNEWWVAGRVYTPSPTDSPVNNVCTALRRWEDGSSIYLIKDLVDGEMYMRIVNVDWNIPSKVVGGGIIARFGLAASKDHKLIKGALRISFDRVNSNTIIFRKLNGELYDFLYRASSIMMSFPPDIDTMSTMDTLVPGKAVLEAMGDCMDAYNKI